MKGRTSGEELRVYGVLSQSKARTGFPELDGCGT